MKPANRFQLWLWRGLALLPLVTLIFAPACRTLPAPTDLSAPGWQVRNGQAVWTAARGAKEVAGELLLATRLDGGCFVQFAKPPFTLVTAQAEPDGWFVQLHQQRRHLGGRGPAPATVVWFELARAVAGQGTRGGWHFESRGGGSWGLRNALTGETLEGFLGP